MCSATLAVVLYTKLQMAQGLFWSLVGSLSLHIRDFLAVVTPSEKIRSEEVGKVGLMYVVFSVYVFCFV